MVHSLKSIPKFLDLIQPDKMPADMPRPKRVSLDYALDHSGDEAFYINLIYPDSTPDEEVAWEKVSPLYYWVNRTLWEASEERTLSYIYFRRESEVKK